MIDMHGVYIIQSEVDRRYYYGYTEKSVEERLAEHNLGRSPYTNKYRPWRLIWFGAFVEKQRAQDFERYLKTGSGHAFSRKRLL